MEDTKGHVLGTVSDVLQPGANDVYVVKQEGQPDLLLPVLEHVILDIDVEAVRLLPIRRNGFNRAAET